MNRNIIIVSAIWCPSCLLIKKHLKKLKQEYPSIIIETLDYDLDEEKIAKYKIGDILPVVIIENNNQEIKRIIGEKNKKEILKELEDLLWNLNY